MLDSLAPLIRRECVHSLSRICRRLALLPNSLDIPFYYDNTGYPLEFDGFADVWKGRCHDQEVAVRVQRVNPTSDLIRIVRVSHWQCPWLIMYIHN